MRAGFALTAAALTSCGAGAAVEPAADVNALCESTLDAIGYQCSDGDTISVRFAPDATCAVVFADHGSYALPAVAANLYSNGSVTLRRNDSGTEATLDGAADGPHSDCHWLLD